MWQFNMTDRASVMLLLKYFDVPTLFRLRGVCKAWSEWTETFLFDEVFVKLFARAAPPERRLLGGDPPDFAFTSDDQTKLRKCLMSTIPPRPFALSMNLFSLLSHRASSSTLERELKNPRLCLSYVTNPINFSAIQAEMSLEKHYRLTELLRNEKSLSEVELSKLAQGLVEFLRFLREALTFFENKLFLVEESFSYVPPESVKDLKAVLALYKRRQPV
eukprot:TRINITY_DN7913_c0_g2_i1.p1 TRINITY_DN7913_c0_g2~~TRINITY_DN7913_c0_g2_i1.p1  ORF type:complete len:218 (-),score=59.32 TRINITY_DN7913_c0_g2_i1:51-704(-)